MTWPEINTPGGTPDGFAAFVQLDPDQPVVRVRFRRSEQGSSWRCDADGPSREALCEHTFAAMPLTIRDGWAAHTEETSTMSMPMPNAVIVAQLALFDELRTRVGHTRESATEIVQQVRPSELFGHEGLIDAEAVETVASRHPVTDGPAPDDKGAVLVALVLAHAMVTGDHEVPAALLPVDLAELRTLMAAQAWITSTVLSILTPGREVELLRHLHQTQVTAMAAGAE